MEQAKCALCGGKDYTVFSKSKDYRCHRSAVDFTLVKCKKCDLIYLNPRPSRKEIGKFYPKDYYQSRSLLLEETLDKFLLKNDIKNLKKYKKNGKILDLGCGAGKFISEVQNLGFETYGVDVSKDAYEIARKKGIKVFHGELIEQKFPNNCFDAVTLWHSFEHLYNPDLTLREIARILKKDGILIMETPNIDSFSFDLFKKYYFHLDLPRHLYHWSIKTMEKILDKNGFKITKNEYFSIGCPFSLFYSTAFFLDDHKIKGFIAKIIMLILSPFLIILTVFSRILPSKGEVIRVYAVQKT